MSTIEKILESLQKTSAAKKEQLNNSYQEKSVWLKNEFDLIKKLIKQNPRDNLGKEPVPSSSTSTSIKEDEECSRKRKSPEATQGVKEKMSPELKRTSIDVEELVLQAGLPADLSRLTKDRLIAELMKRGNETFTMKALKKELVDALKDAIVDAHRANCARTGGVPEDAPTVEHAQDKPSASNPSTSNSGTANPTPGKSIARKGSLMAEFRSLVHGTSATPASTTNTTAAASASDVASEFEARKNRHRDSQARKSQIQSALSSSLTSSLSGALAQAEEAAGSGSVPTDLSTSTSDSAPTISTASASENVWMEVQSPSREREAHAEAEEEAHDMQEAEEAEVEVEVEVEVAEAEVEVEVADSSESEA